MACFWIGILQRLDVNDFKRFESKYGLCIIDKSPQNFVRLLKNCAVKTPNILWNDTKLSSKQLSENYHHIIEYNPHTIGNGYDCSICDPFLILICELFDVDIDHNYNGYLMKYRCLNSFKLIKFKSNTGHFEVA